MAASPFAVFSTSSSTRPLWRFGLICSALALLWVIGSVYGLGIHSPLDTALCNQLAAASAWVLRLIGWDASTGAVQHSLVLLNGQPSVIVGPPCDGLVLYVLLAGFVLAYPGPPQRRLWFIPMGIAALWLLNIIRIVALTLNHRYSPDTFEFDHHYAFNAVAYAALGGLWLLWTRQSSPAVTPSLTQQAPSRSLAAPAQPWLTARVASGIVLLVILVLNSIFRTQIIEVLSAYWTAALASGPAWLHRLPGADAGNVPAGVSRLALPVGITYVGVFLANALLVMHLLLPARNWRVVWRCYAGMLLLYVLILAVSHFGGSPDAYRIGRMLLDFMASLLPVAGLLVLLWRPAPAAAVPQMAAAN